MGRIHGRAKLTGSPLSSRVAQWTQPGLIKSVQRGTIAITGASSNTATISAVDVSQSRLRLLGSRFSNTGSADVALVRITLTNSTTITATVGANTGADTCTASFEITEYWPGVIKQVQRGTISLGGTATINPVNTSKTELDCLGTQDNVAVAGFNFQASIVLTNATTVTATPGSVDAQVTGYQVVEFY